MSEGLRSDLRSHRLRTVSQLVLALGVAALVVIPAVGLLLALLGLGVLLFVQLTRDKKKHPPQESSER